MQFHYGMQLIHFYLQIIRNICLATIYTKNDNLSSHHSFFPFISKFAISNRPTYLLREESSEILNGERGKRLSWKGEKR